MRHVKIFINIGTGMTIETVKSSTSIVSIRTILYLSLLAYYENKLSFVAVSGSLRHYFSHTKTMLVWMTTQRGCGDEIQTYSSCSGSFKRKPFID